MRIGINTRSLIGQKMEGFGNYTLEIVKRLTIAYPEHTFICYFDRPVDPQFNFGSNVICKSVFPPTRHPFLYVIWFQWRLKRAIQKDQLDVFWSPDGMFPLGSKTPVLATIHDLNFEHFPQDLPKWVAWYYKKYFPRFAKAAHHIITVSETTKQDIISNYQLPAEKISVIYNGVNTKYKPLTVQEKETVQQQLGFKDPYFLFVGSLHPRKNIHRLLQAFQLFAQSESTYQLVIVGAAMWKDQTFEIESVLAKRIHFKGHIQTESLAAIMAAASAFVYVPYFEGFGMPLAEAMAAQTPIIAGNKSCLPEIAADAALYVDPFDVEAIAKAMEQLKNDVALQTQLVESGKQRVLAFNWDHAAEKVWQEIQQLVS
jgi:glycosyltransferase involved in cell wall biosynthesis